MPNFSVISFEATLKNPSTGKGESALFQIRKIRSSEVSISLSLPHEQNNFKTLFTISTNIYKTLRFLNETPHANWGEMLDSLTIINQLRKLDSTPEKIMTSLLIAVALETFPFLQLEAIYFPNEFPLNEIHNVEESQLKNQFANFIIGSLMGRNLGGGGKKSKSVAYIVDYFKIPDLLRESVWNVQNESIANIIKRGLLELLDISYMGNLNIKWGNEKIVNLFFVPSALPFNRRITSAEGRAIWETIQDMRKENEF